MPSPVPFVPSHGTLHASTAARSASTGAESISGSAVGAPALAGANFDAIDAIGGPGRLSAKQIERRAAHRATVVARREARRQQRLAALGGGALLGSSGARSAAARTGQEASADHSGKQAAPSTRGATAGDGPAQSASTTPVPGSNGEEILPIKATDMQAADAHTKMRGNGDAFMFADSTLSTTVDLPDTAHSLSVFARADAAAGEWPQLIVTVNGTPVGTIVVDSAVEKKFYLPLQINPGNAVIQVTFPNDYFDAAGGQDRNVYLTKLKIHVGG